MNEGGMSKCYLDAMDIAMPIDNRRNTKKKRHAVERGAYILGEIASSV